MWNRDPVWFSSMKQSKRKQTCHANYIPRQTIRLGGATQKDTQLLNRSLVFVFVERLTYNYYFVATFINALLCDIYSFSLYLAISTRCRCTLLPSLSTTGAAIFPVKHWNCAGNTRRGIASNTEPAMLATLLQAICYDLLIHSLYLSLYIIKSIVGAPRESLLSKQTCAR